MLNPLNLFKKKQKDEMPPAAEDTLQEAPEDENNEDAEPEDKPRKKNVKVDSGKMDSIRISTEIDKLNASVESFGEVRKATTERINALSEQIGELRAMILDRDRTIQQLELKAVKASDLVESVQPDKVMSNLQREDAKFEALKANLEGNEAIMDRVMDELKDIRKKLEFFRGIEEIVKLSEEVKKELVEIKKVEATINTQTDKVDTIYSELRKKFQEIDLFNDNLQEIKANNSQNTSDIDNLKKKMEEMIDKPEFDKLVNKVQRYVDALKEINKSSALTKDLSQLKSILQNI
jgi:chromosome segregation ATPase